MQTFLPYPDFVKSAECLDYRRLGKQRVEAKQIILALENGGGWSRHPATQMWAGHVGSLADYGWEICDEWISRGYVDNLLPFFEDRLHLNTEPPSWLGNPEFHASHRSNLLRKNPVYYGTYMWTEPSNLPYIWPEK